MFRWTDDRIRFMADAAGETDFHRRLAAELLPYLTPEDAVCDALYVAAGFGQVIAARATLAGAEGGCQAEVGAASAMAAAAVNALATEVE